MSGTEAVENKVTKDLSDAETGSNHSDGVVVNNGRDKAATVPKSTFILVCVASALAIVVASSVALIYGLKSRFEKQQGFENQFKAQTDIAYLQISSNVDKLLASLMGLSLSAMNQGLVEDTEYPPGFLTLPDAAVSMGRAARVIAYVPLVENDQRELWQDYSAKHSSWIVEAQEKGNDLTACPSHICKYFSSYAKPCKPENFTSVFPEFIWEFSNYEWEWEIDSQLCWQDYIYASDSEDDFFAPVWQMFPVPVINETNPSARIINYNLADRIFFSTAFNTVRESGQPFFSDMPYGSNYFLEEAPSADRFVAVYPVFDVYPDGLSGDVVGFYVATIDPIDLFRNVHVDGEIIVAIETSCGTDLRLVVELDGDRVTPICRGPGCDPFPEETDDFSSTTYTTYLHDTDQEAATKELLEQKDEEDRWRYYTFDDLGLVDSEMLKYRRDFKLTRYPEYYGDYSEEVCESTMRMYPKRMYYQ